jgi:ribosomal protein L17
VDHVQNSLNLENDENYASRTKIIEENSTLQKEIREKDKRIGHLELLVEKLEEDLQLYRSRVFTEASFKGIRPYDKRLVELLKEPGLHTSREILDRLGIDGREADVVKGVLNQIENLHDYGLVTATGKGWTWRT